MTLVDQYLLIAFIFTVGYMIVVAQALALRRLFRTTAWTLLAGAFVLSGARLVWSLIRLPALIIKAQAEKKMPESLTVEQWIQIGVAFIVMVLFILAFDRLRRDLRRIGV